MSSVGHRVPSDPPPSAARRRRAEGPPVPGTQHGWPAGWTISEARSRRERGRGLLGRRGLGDREGLWLPVRSVHTVGMRFALDLVWLGGGGRVLRLDRAVGPGRVRTSLRARGVVEVAAGHGTALAAALAAQHLRAGAATDGARGGPGAGHSSSLSSGRERVAR